MKINKLFIISFTAMAILSGLFLFNQKPEQRDAKENSVQKLTEVIQEKKEGREINEHSDTYEKESESFKLANKENLLNFDLAHPKVKSFKAYNEFQNRLKGFFQNSNQLSHLEKEKEILELEQLLNEYERNGKIISSEVLLVRLGLLKEKNLDSISYQKQANELAERYSEYSEQGQKQAEQQLLLDKKHQDYKKKEAELVKEILAMSSYPDGISQSEYLRIKLQELREDIYKVDGEG